MIYLIALLPVWISLCVNSIAQDLTDKQVETITKEVSEQFDIYLKAYTTLNYDLWLELMSEENYVPGFSPDSACFYPDFEEYAQEIKSSDARRVRRKSEHMLTQITPLSPNVATVTYTGIFENWFKDEDYIQDFCNATVLWKREKKGWKVIYVHETWIPSQ